MEHSIDHSYMKGFVPYALSTFLIGLVGGLTTVLGPAFVQDMNLPYNNTTWTALSLAISSCVCAPILGNLSDILGRRITLLLGISIFLLGNLLTAIAPTFLFMLIARFIVGIGTASIAPTVMSYIVTEFPQDAVAKGFSFYMLISSSAVIFGPSLGSWILKVWNWRTLMWLCVLLCGIFLILCFLTHPKTCHTPPKTNNFDGPGSFFVVTSFSFLLCIPSLGQNYGWLSFGCLALLLLSLLSFLVLALIEKKAAKPLLSGQFMKRKAFILPVLILFLTQGLMQANMTNMIIFVNYTQPQNTVISGYAISIMYLGMALGSILLGPLSDRIEPKRIVTFSLFFTAIGCGIMQFFTETTSALALAASLGTLGFGLGGNAAVFMKIVLSNLPPDSAGTETGTYGLFRDLAAPFGVAIFVPMFTNQITQLLETNSQITASAAAVNSMHTLSVIELCCIISAIVIAQFLPKILPNK